MKKILMAVFAAMMMCSVYADNELVYDFKASIKRLDLKLNFKSRVHSIAQQFQLKSDSITGYIVLPSCTSCEGGLESTFGEDYTGYAYLMLKGVSKTVNEERKVMKVPVVVKSAVFGANMLCSDAQPMSNPTKALMMIDFKFPEPGELPPDLEPGKLVSQLKGVTGSELNNGFFGASHFGDLSLLKCTGFGSAKVNTMSTPGSIGMCTAGDPAREWKCIIVTAITGTLVGYPTYVGACGNVPLWDGCVNNNGNTAIFNMVNDGCISGTWTLKYNKTLTGSSNKEADILMKLKCTAENMYVVSE